MYNEEEIKVAWKKAREFGIKGYFGSVGNDNKTKKGEKFGVSTYILYLAPHNQSGFNVCPYASEGCSRGCLYTAGHGRWDVVKQSRIKRTQFFFKDRSSFKKCVFSEILQHYKNCKINKVKCGIRLNGLSDISWERVWPQIFEYFPDAFLYDYTKNPSRMSSNYKLPKNYYLTFSKSESNDKEIKYILRSNPKANITVVFNKVPEEWNGREVINGDEHDARFLDKRGVIVGLKAKGDARSDQSGFVIRLPILENA